MSDGPLVPGATGMPPPQVVIEGGDEASRVLMSALSRRIAEIAPGQVLEVTSLAASAHTDVWAWCHVTGHKLVGMLADNQGARFWIRKRGGA
jgi:tRNA 2-thiouridine synthesizing protein A